MKKSGVSTAVIKLFNFCPRICVVFISSTQALKWYSGFDIPSSVLHYARLFFFGFVLCLHRPVYFKSIRVSAVIRCLLFVSIIHCCATSFFSSIILSLKVCKTASECFQIFVLVFGQYLSRVFLALVVWICIFTRYYRRLWSVPHSSHGLHRACKK